MKQHFWFWVLLLIIAGVIEAIPGALSSFSVKYPWMGIVFGIMVWLVGILLSLGFIKVVLRIVEGEKPQVSDLWSQTDKLWNYFAASILYGLLVFVGLILLIVPGIYWGIKYGFYGFVIVDEGLGPIEAMKKSGELTSGSKWHIFSFGIVCLGIWILGLICCAVGLLVAIPVILIATGFVYLSIFREVVEL